MKQKMMKIIWLSRAYRLVRAVAVMITTVVNRILNRPNDLEFVIEWGDRGLWVADRIAGKALYSFPIPAGIDARLYDLKFSSPLTFAAFKDDFSVMAIWLRLGMGGGCLKTILSEPRAGNPLPRIQELYTGEHKTLINAMGLPGKGVNGMLQALVYTHLFEYGRPIGLSIGGNTVEEYLDNLIGLESFMRQQRSAHYYELNISCPNTAEGQDISKNPALLEPLLRQMRLQTNAVIGVKLSPDQPNETLLALTEAIRSVDRTYINAGNTTYRRCEQVGLSANALSIGGGGLSGGPLFPRTLEMVKVLSPLGIPIIATGGISTIDHVCELRDAGAVLVGMATAVVQDMYVIPRLNLQLAQRLGR